MPNAADGGVNRLNPHSLFGKGISAKLLPFQRTKVVRSTTLMVDLQSTHHDIWTHGEQTEQWVVRMHASMRVYVWKDVRASVCMYVGTSNLKAVRVLVPDLVVLTIPGNGSVQRHTGFGLHGLAVQKQRL